MWRAAWRTASAVPWNQLRVVGRLLGREDLDESLAEQIHPVGLGDVAVERR